MPSSHRHGGDSLDELRLATRPHPVDGISFGAQSRRRVHDPNLNIYLLMDQKSV